MQKDIIDTRRDIALTVTVALLVAVVAGAYMLTCVEDAQAAASLPLHADGTICDLHEGHTVSNAADATLPHRPGVPGMAVSVVSASSLFASSDRVATTAPSIVPPPAADPLCGRLLL